MADKTKSVDSSQAGQVAINFGNVEGLKVKLADEQNKSLRAIKDLLIQISASLIRLEGKYDANQGGK